MDENILDNAIEEVTSSDQVAFDSAFDPMADGFKAFVQKSKWKLPQACIITKEGVRILKKDPDLSAETIQSLIKTDAKLLGREAIKRINGKSKQALVKDYFYTFNGKDHIANDCFAHLSQCIREDLNQYMADLACRFASDKRISFLEAAIYITSLYEVRGCFIYTAYDTFHGYGKIEWHPRKMNVTENASSLPTKLKQRKRGRKVAMQYSQNLPACPLCGCPASTLRGGIKNMQWAVCCTDPDRECKLYLPDQWYDEEIDAVKFWNSIADSGCPSTGNSSEEKRAGDDTI